LHLEGRAPQPLPSADGALCHQTLILTSKLAAWPFKPIINRTPSCRPQGARCITNSARCHLAQLSGMNTAHACTPPQYDNRRKLSASNNIHLPKNTKTALQPCITGLHIPTWHHTRESTKNTMQPARLAFSRQWPKFYPCHLAMNVVDFPIE